MRKNILVSYANGIYGAEQAVCFFNIIRYFLPELIIAVLLYSVPFWFEAWCIGCLKSTSTYATLGVANTVIHLMIKLAEAVSVGTTVLVGRYNGMNRHKEVGETVRDTFWSTLAIGLFFACTLYGGASFIYTWFGVSNSMVERGLPFLRTRAIGVLFQFVFFGLVGFLRGIQSPHVATVIFTIGSLTLMICDYGLVLGGAGMPQYGLIGAAYAAVIQNGVMVLLALGYILFSPVRRRYLISLRPQGLCYEYMIRLLQLSWPVALDKVIFAISYVWLGMLICPMSKYVTASFSAIRDMERFILLPGVACAQVITYLVSNDIGAGYVDRVKGTVKRVLFFATVLVASLLIVVGFFSKAVVGLFDQKGTFTEFAITVFPILGVLSFFDLLQLVLSGALRGAGDVKMVMRTRMFVLLCYFFPVSYGISLLPVSNEIVRFLLIYGSFYLGTAGMGLIYIHRFRSDDWQIKIVRKQQ